MVIRLIMYVMKLNKVTECVSEYQDLVLKQFNVHINDVPVHVHTCVCIKNIVIQIQCTYYRTVGFFQGM